MFGVFLRHEGVLRMRRKRDNETKRQGENYGQKPGYHEFSSVTLGCRARQFGHFGLIASN
jgi:hypothetical protein